MQRTKIEKAGDELVIVIPSDVELATGLFEGEEVEVLVCEDSIHAFRDLITEKDFPDLRWHDLRHEAISRFFERTDLRDHEIMAITGHLTPAMLARYTHLRADRLGAKLPGGKLHRAA